MTRRASIAFSIVAVVAAYVFFASGGRWTFPRTEWYANFAFVGEGYYGDLAEGFLGGATSMAHLPDPRLAQLHDPYSFEERRDAKVQYLWDASYYRGRYYLYFSPLPVLLFYLPYRVIAGAHPSDALAATLFCAWAFFAGVAFVVRAIERFRVPAPLWLLLLGLGSVVPFVLGRVRVYEVAILAGMAMSATWALATLRFIETRSRSSAVWMGVWLALAIATRPNLIVLVVITAIVVFRTRRDMALAVLAPLVLVAAAMLAYNYARFGRLFELGITYQLTFVPMREHAVCSVCSGPEVMRMITGARHYLGWTPVFRGAFPFVDLQPNDLDPRVSFPSTPEQAVGILTLVPLALIGSIVALFNSGSRAGRYTIAAAWLVLLGLSACWWITARYALDFMLLMIMGTIVCVEAELARRPWLRGVAIALACYSIVVGTLLGFRPM